ncbi:MAG: leader peptidase (prepilin peptidase) / N-methyltransferase [Acidimicrobiaceae bacterium]
MNGAVVAACAVLGVLAGPLLTRVIDRIPSDKEPLAWPRYLVWLANGALWALVANEFHRWWVVVPFLLVASMLLVVSVIDLQVYRIPDKVVFPFLALSLVMLPIATRAVTPSNSDAVRIMTNALIGMVAYFVVLFIPHLISPRGMGFGDVKLALVMGLYLGWLGVTKFDAFYLVLVAVFLGCLAGTVFGLLVSLARRKRGAFPFGPALAAASFLVMLTSERYLTGR